MFILFDLDFLFVIFGIVDFDEDTEGFGGFRRDFLFDFFKFFLSLFILSSICMVDFEMLFSE